MRVECGMRVLIECANVGAESSVQFVVLRVARVLLTDFPVDGYVCAWYSADRVIWNADVSVLHCWMQC